MIAEISRAPGPAAVCVPATMCQGRPGVRYVEFSDVWRMKFLIVGRTPGAYNPDMSIYPLHERIGGK
jgi:hypothetical protein